MGTGPGAAAHVAALALALLGCGAPDPRTAVLIVQSHPDGGELTRVAVDENAGFTLTYIHSVTLTPIVARYAVAGCDITQVRETFSQHGPGLASSADAPDMTWRRQGDAFVVEMRQPIANLVVRADPEYRNRLDAGFALDLTRWGRRALRIVPAGCHHAG